MIEKKVTWSHSSLKDFEGCARRYHEVKVLKNYPFTDTQATIYGKDLHTAAEHYVAHNTPLPAQFEFVQPVLDALMTKPGRKLTEYQMAVTSDLKPCAWAADNMWARGIADLLIVDDDDLTAWVADYKTGNNRYPDTDQLKLMSLMVFIHFPHIRQVKSALLFVVKNDMVTMSMNRDETDKAWWAYRERVARLEAAFENDVWNPRQTPLCPWCVVTSCEFNPKH
jgi:hypothetical protein